MYKKDGESYYVVDSHIHFWDGRPSNQRNVTARALPPASTTTSATSVAGLQVWTLEKGSYRPKRT